MITVPASKPKLPKSDFDKVIRHYGVDTDRYKVVVGGSRGYYEDSIGEVDKNDRGVYDDAMFIRTPDFYATFNANCDPSTYRKGYGFGDAKGIATLKADVYYAWKLDYHKGKYLALCQRLGEMTVIRDGNPPYEHKSKWLGINGHKGGINTTASLGCQTIVPQQWNEFISDCVRELKKYYGDDYNKVVVPYCLIEEKDRRLL